MTRDEIIRMAREAGLPVRNIAERPTTYDHIAGPRVGLERFAALVAAAEREACAKLLEANAATCREESMVRLVIETNAAAIRARGQAE